ncbi:MAG: hypothetical protein OEU09_14515 [Rhodospirillales bacterium]|nr:hypothetical protein [Rhodospirillales bacterium]MDH3912503.1 hypothetical protein [Rhodospirillales bacterium]MDH3919726.1 hypothetical protein [Rhodospirillales bacterium]MDH3965475.1 hypothetical protein [Rhodospirillales bacterium]
MKKVAYALAGAVIAAFAAGSVRAASTSTELSVRVTVVPPGSLGGGPGGPSAEPARTTSEQPATAPPPQDAAPPAK